jgi:hypothetical protein
MQPQTNKKTEAQERWARSESRRLLDVASKARHTSAPHAYERVWTRLERAQKKPLLTWRGVAAAAAAACAVLYLALPKPSVDAPALPVAAAIQAVDLPGEARLVLAARTEAHVVADGPAGVTLQIDRGAVLLHVQPRTKDRAFVIRAPGVSVRVVGTVLRVAVDGAGHATVSVGHGAVEVTPAGAAPIPVKSGERWPANAANATPSEQELALLGDADREGVTKASFASAVAESTLGAETALYEAGVQALQHGEPQRALQIWREERRRFPAGVLAVEAQTSMIDALLSTRDRKALGGEIDRYLAAYPNGLRAPEMHFLRASLAPDCRRAQKDLAAALLHPAPAWQDDARRLRARCEDGAR